MEFLEATRERERLWREGLSRLQRGWHLAAVSALGLFAELLLIRYLDAQVRPLAYTKNLALIGSFLGLGLGFALARARRSLLPLALPALALSLLVAALDAALPENLALAGPEVPEANLGVSFASGAAPLALFYGLVALVFLLVVVATLPLGQLTGFLMEGWAPLGAYSINVLGALGGIGAFAALNGWGVPPWVGAAAVLLALVFYAKIRLAPRCGATVLALAVPAAMYAVDHAGGRETYWSPYNKIEVSRLPPVTTEDGRSLSPGWVLRVQNLYYQRLLDLRDETVEATHRAYSFLAQAYYAYNYPYTVKKFDRVLVVGAGGGNDVAAALRHGAREVVAVEIDPWIVELGRRLHPERPYDDPRVRVVIQDARAFLRRTSERFDLIVFGLLDAHTSLFSSFSANIRLDNYVYTVEALSEAMGRLAEDGVLALSFYAEHPWLVSRLEAMLAAADGGPPLVTPVFYDAGYLYLAGPGLPAAVARRPEISRGLPATLRLEHPAGPLATDDWPFLYLRARTIPRPTVFASLGILAAGLLCIRSVYGGFRRLHRHFFFLGAGFLLLETAAIAKLGLLYGATWRVSAVTIAGVLTLILAANLATGRWGSAPRPLLYACLGALLLGTHLLPPGGALGPGAWGAWSITALQLSPLLCAALIFASSIRQVPELGPVLASNLAGSVLGGLLENACLVTGISGLWILALVLYAVSFRR